MYLSYDLYRNFGGTVEEPAFLRLEYMAERKIDRYTQRRVRNMKFVPEAVQRCATELINAMGNADPAGTVSSAPLSGFSNDGYSESYASPVTQDTLEAGLYGLISDYLATEIDDSGTPLLYQGVD